MSSHKGHSRAKKKNPKHGRKHRRGKNLDKKWLPRPNTQPKRKKRYGLKDSKSQTPFHIPIYLKRNLRTPEQLGYEAAIRQSITCLIEDAKIYENTKYKTQVAPQPVHHIAGVHRSMPRHHLLIQGPLRLQACRLPLPTSSQHRQTNPA